MGLFDAFRSPDINRGVEDYRAVPGAILLDVRTPQEYRKGHIPGSENVPLQNIDRVGAIAGQLDTPLYVYCHSGARSRQAVATLQRKGYTNVRNIGGIDAWTGKVER